MPAFAGPGYLGDTGDAKVSFHACAGPSPVPELRACYALHAPRDSLPPEASPLRDAYLQPALGSLSIASCSSLNLVHLQFRAWGIVFVE